MADLPRPRDKIIGHSDRIEACDLSQNFRAAPSLNDDRQVWAPTSPEWKLWRSG
jgi:hypothetical protein